MFGSPLDSERVFDSIAPVSRTRVRRRRLAVVLVGAAATGLWASPLAHAFGPSQPDSGVEHSVVVRPGDTLWSIAQRVAPSEDPRAVVDELIASNRVDPGWLVPGQRLVVPAGG